MSNRRRRTFSSNPFSIPEKANRILNLILIALVLIVLRVWHLAVVQYDVKVEESRKPQRRVAIEPAKRGTIRDRFNIPLAINKMHYQASIVYSQFRQIPYARWETAPDGTRTKFFKRREYITSLAQLLADELQLDPERLEDLIHSKGSLYYHIPFVIKDDISEREYYRLKMLEKDWIGIHVQSLPKRSYPRGRLASDIIGYMGAINRQEYEAIIQELQNLTKYITAKEEGEELPLPEGLEHPSQARKRLKDLQELAYTVNDFVGKSGIEGQFEEELRGFQGRKSYYSDSKGNFLRDLPGAREPLSGQRFLLTISADLQEYAELLLAQNEAIRETQITTAEKEKIILTRKKQPWIKGGAIVAMEPQTGDILALASYPRFDPNDFIVSSDPDISKQKRSNIARWFESEDHIAAIWDRRRALERESYHSATGTVNDEELQMTWANYIAMILPEQHPIKNALLRIGNIKNARELQFHINFLINLSGQNNIYWVLNALYKGDGHVSYGKQAPNDVKLSIEKKIQQESALVAISKKKIDNFFKGVPRHYDKVLLVDLCRLVVPGELFSNELIKKVGNQNLASYREASAAMAAINPVVREMSKNLYHALHFKDWRKEHEKDFIKQKREEEKLASRYPKPFLDYFDSLENKMFEEFWKMYRWDFIFTLLTGSYAHKDIEELNPYLEHFSMWHQELTLGAHQGLVWNDFHKILKETIIDLSPEYAINYLTTLRSYEELNRPLMGHYKHLGKSKNQQLEKHLAAAFYPKYGFGYGRSQAYRQASTQGSIFKLVTAYEALVQRYEEIGESKATIANLNPLEIIDHFERRGKDAVVGYHADGKPIPQLYKKGRLPRSSTFNIGKLDIIKALETSSNPYFSLLAGDLFKSPNDLSRAARDFSYGSRTGIELPAEIAGKVPDDLVTNRTGLYAMAIGQHSLVVTPLQTAVMMSALANGGKVLKPKIVSLTAGTKPRADIKGRKNVIPAPHEFEYQDSFASVGLDFPIFTAISINEKKSGVKRFESEIKNKLFMPAVVRSILLEGMRRVVAKMQQSGLGALSKVYNDYPEAISDYVELQDQLIGKTSTSESMEHLDLDCIDGTSLCTHVWFGGIAFDEDTNTREKKLFLFRDQFGKPELVVVVYLRYGHFGRVAAPLAAQMVKKWRMVKRQSNENKKKS